MILSDSFEFIPKKKFHYSVHTYQLDWNSKTEENCLGLATLTVLRIVRIFAHFEEETSGRHFKNPYWKNKGKFLVDSYLTYFFINIVIIGLCFLAYINYCVSKKNSAPRSL